ncbi:MAG: methionyl-tRNA formyltransferase [Chthoniobacterales bacterium]|nr:methionyl-tRNA formyltransferase [Chthoniobacterales bacterium]
MKIVFVASGDIAIPSFRWLLDAPGVEVAALVTQPDRPSGRGLKLKPSLLKQLAIDRGIPVLQPEKIRVATPELSTLQPDLLVVMAYGQILPQAVLDIPRLGALNLHASLLPRHRGASPVHAAILAGDSMSGVTVMWMDAGMDTGDILLARECVIGPEETAGSLHDKLAVLAPQALSAGLDLISRDDAPHIPQDAALATYAPKLGRGMGTVHWSMPAGEIALRIRGLHPWPGCTTEVVLDDGSRVLLKIHRAKIAAGAPEPCRLRFACGGGGVLELLEVQPAGGKRMTSDDFVRGHRVVRAL